MHTVFVNFQKINCRFAVDFLALREAKRTVPLASQMLYNIHLTMNIRKNRLIVFQ